MNKTISDYIKSCEEDILYKLFDLIIDEMNKRKERESSGGGINAYIQSNKLEERQSLHRRNAPDVDTS